MRDNGFQRPKVKKLAKWGERKVPLEGRAATILDALFAGTFGMEANAFNGNVVQRRRDPGKNLSRSRLTSNRWQKPVKYLRGRRVNICSCY